MSTVMLIRRESVYPDDACVCAFVERLWLPSAPSRYAAAVSVFRASRVDCSKFWDCCHSSRFSSARDSIKLFVVEAF